MSAVRKPLIAIPSQTVGPYLHIGLDTEPLHGRMYGPETPGERLVLRIRVTDGAGNPVPDALIELWQADAAGEYVDRPDHDNPDPGHSFRGWGRRATNDDGWCEFETIRPGATTAPDGRRLSSHISVCLFARGLLRHLFTRIYFEDDPTLADDPVLALVPEDRRATLVARRDGDAWIFPLRLQGAGETVFFDL